MSFEIVNFNSDYNFLLQDDGYVANRIQPGEDVPVLNPQPSCNTRCGIWSSTSCGAFDCEEGGCKKTSFGCGMFWMQDCKDKC